MTASNLDAAVAERAARQHSAFSRDQAEEVGFTRRQIEQCEESGRWLSLHRNVFAFAGSPSTWERRLWAAHLQVPKSSVSHRSAGALDGLPHCPRIRPELIVPTSGYHRTADIRVHRYGDLLPRHIRNLAGFRCTTTIRTTMDLAAVLPPEQLKDVVSHVLVTKMADLASLQDEYLALRRRGKRGFTALGVILDDHLEAVGESHLELTMLELLRDLGLPSPELQVKMPWRNGVPGGVVDSVYHPIRLILEADGRAWHDRHQAYEEDRWRDLEAAAHGYETRRFTHQAMTRRRPELEPILRSIVTERSRLLGVTFP